MLAGAGLRLKSDYVGQLGVMTEDRRPFLMGLFSDDPESRLLGTAAASLFRFLGRDLILHDTRANVILDRISCVIECVEVVD
jgi:hypothetical protein